LLASIGGGPRRANRSDHAPSLPADPRRPHEDKGVHHRAFTSDDGATERRAANPCAKIAWLSAACAESAPSNRSRRTDGRVMVTDVAFSLNRWRAPRALMPRRGRHWASFGASNQSSRTTVRPSSSVGSSPRHGSVSFWSGSPA